MARATWIWSGLAAVLGAAVVMLVSASPEVLAHGPTRQKVTETVEINAPASKVWAVIENFQDMSWHPAVEKTVGEGGNDKGAKRTLTLQGGGLIHEALLKHDAERMMMKYEITEVDVKVLPVKNYSAMLSVKSEGDTSTVTWKGAFYRGFLNNDPPPELNEAAAKKAISGVFRGGLDALKKKLEGSS